MSITIQGYNVNKYQTQLTALNGIVLFIELQFCHELMFMTKPTNKKVNKSYNCLKQLPKLKKLLVVLLIELHNVQ